MTSLQVMHLIFTRVEADYSPSRRSGFQTVYKSQSISDLLVKEIEQRIQCFNSVDGRGRLQYFLLDKFAVVSKTVPIASHPIIIDRSGRGGVFLVHCLVARIQSLEYLGNNPFAILDSYEPFSDVNLLIKVLNQESKIYDEITIQPRLDPKTDLLSFDDILKLVMLVQPNNQVNKSNVLFCGSGIGIEEVLRTLHSLLTPKQRLNCTFDTCLDRCNLPHGIVYWASGYSRNPGSSFAATVDVERHQITLASETSKQDLYTIWLKESAGKHPLLQVISYADDAYVLATAFENQQPLSRLDVNTGLACEFFQTHKQLLTSKLEKSIEFWLPTSLAKNLAAFMISSFPEDEGELLNTALSAAAAEKAPADRLSEWVLAWLVSEEFELPISVYKKIQNLAKNGNFPRLLFHIATTSPKVDTKARNEAIELMNNESYNEELRYFMKPIEPEHFVHKRYITTLLEWGDLNQMSGKQTANFLKRIVDERLESYLDQVISLVKLLAREDISQIEKIIRKNKQIPLAFKRAVEQRRHEVGDDPSFLERLKLRI